MSTARKAEVGGVSSWSALLKYRLGVCPFTFRNTFHCSTLMPRRHTPHPLLANRNETTASKTPPINLY